MAQPTATPVSPWHGSQGLAWLQLCRIPNVFTAIADIWMGYFFVHSDPTHWLPLGVLTLGSATLYTAGIVLNDVFDIEQDRRERPHRPLPSGRIPIRHAAVFGWTLIVMGVSCGWLVGWYGDHDARTTNRAGVVATALAMCIVAYDVRLKRAWTGPIAMGLCRTLNVLLGMSLGGTFASRERGTGDMPFSADALLVAAGIGVYVAGVTWFARTEAHRTARRQLVGGWTTMLAGVAVFGAYPLARTPTETPHLSTTVWWLLLALLAMPIVRRGLRAIARPDPPRIQATVKLAILSLILWDASIGLSARGPTVACAIAALLIPSLLLARFVYST